MNKINEKLNTCAMHYPTFDFYCCYNKKGCYITQKTSNKKRVKKKTKKF